MFSLWTSGVFASNRKKKNRLELVRETCTKCHPLFKRVIYHSHYDRNCTCSAFIPLLDIIYCTWTNTRHQSGEETASRLNANTHFHSYFTNHSLNYLAVKVPMLYCTSKYSMLQQRILSSVIHLRFKQKTHASLTDF